MKRHREHVVLSDSDQDAEEGEGEEKEGEQEWDEEGPLLRAYGIGGAQRGENGASTQGTLRANPPGAGAASSAGAGLGAVSDAGAGTAAGGGAGIGSAAGASGAPVLDPRTALELEDEVQDIDARLQQIPEEIQKLLEEQDALEGRRGEILSRLQTSAAAAALAAARGDVGPTHRGTDPQAVPGDRDGAATGAGPGTGEGGSGFAVGGAGPNRACWGQTFEWDGEVQEALRGVFGIRTFRRNQREIINAILCSRDVFVIMPAGGGKSLCYSLPAVMRPGLTLVVSPLLSLIYDQIMQLQELGIQAAMLTSATTKEEERAVYEFLERGTGPHAGGAPPGDGGSAQGKGKVRGRGRGRGGGASATSPVGRPTPKGQGEGEAEEGGEGEGNSSGWGGGAGGGGLKLLYVTPEKVAKSKRFMSKLEKCNHAGRLALIAIDEAHCCSQWGHDFRPDYAQLALLKRQFPKVPMMALTATATERVQVDVRDMLQMRRCEVFVSSVNRPNLYYEVRPKTPAAAQTVGDIASFIEANYPGRASAGIVYCFSRRECEEVADGLRKRRISAQHYHADMDPQQRMAVHTSWSKGQIQVIVGTVAFGMGINKPDVRFVIHHSLSKSIETYYQESGRAGRDGKPSRCVLFFRSADVPRQSSMVFAEAAGLLNLYSIARFCESKSVCRRVAIAEHFGETPPECHRMCDVCRDREEPGSSMDTEDLTAQAVSILRFVDTLHKESDKMLTMLQLADQWRTEDRHSNPGYNKGTELPREKVDRLILQLLLRGVLKEEFQHTAYSTNAYLLPGRYASRLLQGRMKIELETFSSGSEGQKGREGTPKPAQPADGRRTEARRRAGDVLRHFREALAAERSLFPFAVLSDPQVARLAEEMPTTAEQLDGILGEKQKLSFGQAILDTLASVDTYKLPELWGGDDPEGGWVNPRSPKSIPTKNARKGR